MPAAGAYITVRPVEDDRPIDSPEWYGVFRVAPGIDPVNVADRGYGRLDSAVAKAWTIAGREGLPLALGLRRGVVDELDGRPWDEADPLGRAAE